MLTFSTQTLSNRLGFRRRLQENYDPRNWPYWVWASCRHFYLKVDQVLPQYGISWKKALYSSMSSGGKISRYATFWNHTLLKICRLSGSKLEFEGEPNLHENFQLLPKNGISWEKMTELVAFELCWPFQPKPSPIDSASDADSRKIMTQEIDLTESEPHVDTSI